MKARIFGLLSVLTGVALGIAACGGGGTGGGSGPASAGTNVASLGMITGFGSVIVNGVKYETSSTSVISDDSDVSSSALKVGMMVRVSGKINDDLASGSASVIEYEDSLAGPAANISSTGFTILGQKVSATATTVFDGAANLAAIANGQNVEVSGFANADGSITATRIEAKGSTEFKVRGIVGNVDPTGKTFTLTITPALTFTVDFSAATIVPNAGALVNGAYVKVKTSTAPNGTTITATKVSVKKSGLEDSARAEVQGLVAGFDSALKNFTVNGVKVDVSGIALPAGFADGVKVEVEGGLNNGVLTAVKCKVENESEDELGQTGAVTAKTATTLTVNGTEYTVSASTIFKDDSNKQDRLISFASIAVNDTVEVDGYRDAAGSTVIATKIERK